MSWNKYWKKRLEFLRKLFSNKEKDNRPRKRKSRATLIFLVLLACRSTHTKPIFDPLTPSTWGPPSVLVVNQLYSEVEIAGPEGIYGSVESALSKCFVLPRIFTGSIWLTAKISEYESIRTIPFKLPVAPGWRWDITSRESVHVVPTWPCDWTQ
jgi:hypothetical protein